MKIKKKKEEKKGRKKKKEDKGKKKKEKDTKSLSYSKRGSPKIKYILRKMKVSPHKLLSIQGRIPVKWTAIEAMTGRMEYSTKSDV